MLRYFKPLVITSIIMIYLIILAGAVVRMTGSGMGCPDWPKCFGYYIPPTQESQIQWKAHHHYQEGTIIIVQESLRIAPIAFTSGSSYAPQNWDNYTKHDYAKFNTWHTWIEYINRLVTVIAGFPILLMLIGSFGYWKSHKKITFLAVGTVMTMGVEAYLGKTVVDSNLLPLKITIHLLMAFVILAVLITILLLLNSKQEKKPAKISKTLKHLLIATLLLTCLQIIMGTQVRQFIDEQVTILGEDTPALWLQNPNLLFYIHRSFSIVVILTNCWIFFLNKKSGYPIPLVLGVLSLIGLEALTGILMQYFHFPFLSQPLHLLLSAVLFGLQFYILLQAYHYPSSMATKTASIIQD